MDARPPCWLVPENWRYVEALRAELPVESVGIGFFQFADGAYTSFDKCQCLGDFVL